MRFRLSGLTYYFFIILVGLLLTVTPARADLKIMGTRTLTGIEDLKRDVYSVPENFTYYFKGDKFREDVASNRVYYIYDCAKDRYYAIDREAQEYAIMTLDEALSRRSGVLEQFKVAGRAAVEPGGSTMIIAGKPAKNYILSMDLALLSERTGATVLTVKMEGEQWATNTEKISPKCQRIVKAIYARGIFRYNKLLEPLYPQVSKVKGVPLSFDMILTLNALSGTEYALNGTIEAHSRVKSVSTKTIPAAFFEVPKGFRLVPRVRGNEFGSRD
jgi:hypothetical protein